MLGIPANLIQQAEKFTQKYDDDEQVLRLHNGKIVAGEFKGTRLQRFFGRLVRLFRLPGNRKEEYLKARQASFEDISKQEQQALASALGKTISKRTPQPYETTSSKIKDIRALLKNSQADRNKFDRIVATITDAITHPSAMISDPLDGAKKAADMAVENQQICRVAQMQQLRSDVTEILSQAGIKEATIKQLDDSLDDKTVKLALYNVACDYARRVYSPPKNWSGPEEPATEPESSPKTPSETQDKEWSSKREMTDSFRQNNFKFKSPADMAVDQMLAQGDYHVDPDDIPEGNHKAKKIRQLQKINEPWAKEAIELLKTDSPEDAKKAILLENVNLRSRHHAKLQKEKAKAVDQTQTAYWSRTRLGAMKKVEKLENQGINDNSHFPQEYRDKAAQQISKPLYYDNVELPMDEAIDQTINMLKNAYPSLAHKGNAFREQELRERLQRFLTNRQIETVEVPAKVSSFSQTDETEIPPSTPLLDELDENTLFAMDDDDKHSESGDSGIEVRSGRNVLDDDVFSTPPTSLKRTFDQKSGNDGIDLWHLTEPPPFDKGANDDKP